MTMKKPKKSESGMAMLMALITMVVLTVLAGELVYQSGVFSSVVFRQRDQLRATLLARSGLRLALLQLKAAKKAKAKAKNIGLGDNTAITDKIWQTPLVLPPPPIPGLSQIDNTALDGLRKSLGFEGTIATTIVGENGRASLHQLLWPSGKVKIKGVDDSGAEQVELPDPVTGLKPAPGSNLTPEQKKEQLKKTRENFVALFDAMLEKKRQSDDAFRNKYPSLSGEFLVGNILAWMDPETKVDGENRDKNEYYSSLPTPYAVKNAPIASESEFHMIKGFDEEISKLVSDNFTVQASSSLDVNKASLLLIHAYIHELSPDALEDIGKRRNDEALGGAFKDAADFWAFVATKGNYDDAKKRFEETGVKILEPETSYRVVVVAQSGMSTKTWLANVGPLPPKVPGAKPQPGEVPPPPPPPKKEEESKDGTKPPATESSDTDSLNIVYLKSE